MKTPASRATAHLDKIPPIGYRIWSHSHRQTRRMSHPHTHTDLEINFPFHGSIEYLHGGRTVRLTGGTWALFWAGIPHRLIHSDQLVEGIWITFPLDWMLAANPAGLLKERLLAGEMLLSDLSDFQLDRLLFQRWLDDFSSGEPTRLQQSRLELEARIHRFALSLPQKNRDPSQPRTSGARFSAEAAAAYLTRNYQHPLTVNSAAKALRLHPKYLLNAFKSATGLTLWDYLIRLRLAHAQRLLLTTDYNIIDIALESGFESSSAFYRHFRTKTGQTPGAFRKKHLLDR